MPATRPAAVAGMFYPADNASLRSQVLACLNASPEQHAAIVPKLLVVPHAGYEYSGAIAGRAYATLAPVAALIRRVVLLGPTHRLAVRGLAVPTVDAFETPLGPVRIDVHARNALADLGQVVADDRVHTHEHSLEVQLPFLQAVLGASFELLPLAVGDASAEQVAQVIERLWGGDETLFVISTDLSHFLSCNDARTTDRMTVARIIRMATDFDPFEACGAHALNGAMLAARRHGLQASLLGLCNSGDTTGDRKRVVGYAALAFTAPLEAAPVPDLCEVGLGIALLSRVRNRIAARLGLPASEPEPDHPALVKPAASFVTLRDRRGELRGCIGSLEADLPLAEDLGRNALAAAFGDSRFKPLAVDEWTGLTIEVSLLDAAMPVPAAASRQAMLRQLQPHLDGVIVEWRGHSATFLPQVWQQLPDPDDFIAALLRKAGLAGDFWAEDLQLQRYRVRHYSGNTSPQAQ